MNNFVSKQSSIRKSVVLYAGALIFAGVLLFGFLQILDYSLVHPTKIIEETKNENISWNILDVIIDNNFISISGWVQLSDNDLDNFNVVVVLENSLSKEAISIPTVLVETQAQNKESNSNNDISKIAFLSKVNKRIINFDQNNFDIYIKMQTINENIFLKTNQSLNN